jgi:peptidoglycan-associated lipoprotein
MVSRTLGILILIFCLGLMVAGCPKQTVKTQEPTIKTAEEVRAEKEREAKIEAEREAKEARDREVKEARDREVKEAREKELAKIREEEAKKTQEKEFEKSLVAKKEPGIQGEILESRMLKDIHFDFDEYNVRSEDTEILKDNAALLMKYTSVKIQIEGHCDERGTVEYNLALGERRANSTKKYLVSLGISPDRITTISYGEERPLDPGHHEEAWAKNRRAHTIILSK